MRNLIAVLALALMAGECVALDVPAPDAPSAAQEAATDDAPKKKKPKKKRKTPAPGGWEEYMAKWKTDNTCPGATGDEVFKTAGQRKQGRC